MTEAEFVEEETTMMEESEGDITCEEIPQVVYQMSDSVEHNWYLFHYLNCIICKCLYVCNFVMFLKVILKSNQFFIDVFFLIIAQIIKISVLIIWEKTFAWFYHGGKLQEFIYIHNNLYINAYL